MPVYNGYYAIAKRKLIEAHLHYECLCKVHATPLNRALFECCITLNENLIAMVTANNPTSAAKSALKESGIAIKLKNGSNFFGLTLIEVMNMQPRGRTATEEVVTSKIQASKDGLAVFSGIVNVLVSKSIHVFNGLHSYLLTTLCILMGGGGGGGGGL